MFLQIISILILLTLIAVILELRKIKMSVNNLKSEVNDINLTNEPKRCIWEYTTEDWWNLELPEVRVPTKILKSTGSKPSGPDVQEQVGVIQEVLKNFNIGVEKMNQPFIGPTVTTYSFKPAMNVKLKDIVELQDNFSLELKSHPIRIEAPIMGTDFVGIQAPNYIKAKIGLKSELETREFKNAKGELVVPFGRDMKYNQWNVDLFELPHLLIGGATNSGKSVFINSLIISLMTKHSPKTLRFILSDMKRIELPVYNNLPYLLTPVIMDFNKAVNALKWCVNEMDNRFQSLADAEVRNIVEYNKQSKDKIPYIVFVIDEMADLSVQDENKIIEKEMIKILQMGRAVGIHIIVASSRPCDETFSGLLRANFPAKLAFATASGIDSEIILDMKGAEKLLGRGDALFTYADLAKPVRLQVSYVSEEDISHVVEYIKEHSNKYKPIDAVSSLFPEDNPDELLEAAKNIVIESGKASASFIQRRLNIGYARSAYLLDQLENSGIVGPANGTTPREVLVSPKKE